MLLQTGDRGMVNDVLFQEIRRRTEDISIANRLRMRRLNLLEDVFKTVASQLDAVIEQKVDALNRTELGNVFTFTRHVNVTMISRSDTHQEYSVICDPLRFKVSFSCDKPIKYDHVLELAVDADDNESMTFNGKNIQMKDLQLVVEDALRPFVGFPPQRWL